MQTDIPLRTLTKLRPADLLPLLGMPDATVVDVESLELPMVATALDTLLRLRSPQGTIYLHLVEWQGYRDRTFLARAQTYLGWLGQAYPGIPIVVTLVYLHPGDDMGGTLQHLLDGVELWSISFRVVRLWEQDPATAVASGLPGLAVLSPLMQGAGIAKVEGAAALVLARAEAGQQQADLLTILGIFAEPLMDTERFMRLVGRERLMASDLITYLTGERIAEVEREYAAREQALEQEYAAREQERAAAQAALLQTLEQERAAREQEWAAREQERAAREQERAAAQAAVAALVGAVGGIVIARFPNTPAALVDGLRHIRDIERLQALHGAVLHAPDQASVERLLQPQ